MYLKPNKQQISLCLFEKENVLSLFIAYGILYLLQEQRSYDIEFKAEPFSV
jgi:hypothetical protein